MENSSQRFWYWRKDGVWQKIHDALCRLVRKNKDASQVLQIFVDQSKRPCNFNLNVRKLAMSPHVGTKAIGSV